MRLLKVAMLQAIITVQFEVNCMAMNNDFNTLYIMHAVINLLFVYGLLRQFKQNLHTGSLPIPTTCIPSQRIHRVSYMQKAQSKLSPIKNPNDMYICNRLSNVAIPRAIHMPCINIHCAWYYQLQMVFVRACLPWLQWVTHCMDLTAFSCFCSKIKRYIS